MIKLTPADEKIITHAAIYATVFAIVWGVTITLMLGLGLGVVTGLLLQLAGFVVLERGRTPLGRALRGWLARHFTYSRQLWLLCGMCVCAGFFLDRMILLLLPLNWVQPTGDARSTAIILALLFILIHLSAREVDAASDGEDDPD